MTIRFCCIDISSIPSANPAKIWHIPSNSVWLSSFCEDNLSNSQIWTFNSIHSWFSCSMRFTTWTLAALSPNPARESTSPAIFFSASFSSFLKAVRRSLQFIRSPIWIFRFFFSCIVNASLSSVSNLISWITAISMIFPLTFLLWQTVLLLRSFILQT